MSKLGGYRGAWAGYVTSLESKAVVNSAVFSLDLKMAKLSLWRSTVNSSVRYICKFEAKRHFIISVSSSRLTVVSV